MEQPAVGISREGRASVAAGATARGCGRQKEDEDGGAYATPHGAGRVT